MYTRSLLDPVEDKKLQTEISFRHITLDDIQRYGELVPEEKRPRFIKYLSLGNLGFGAFDADTIVAHTWISLEDKYENRANEMIQVKPGEAYAFGIETLPEYRNQDLGSTLFLFEFKYLRENGIEKVISVVWIKNYPSRRMCEKVGFLPAKILYKVNFKGFELKFSRTIKNANKFMLKERIK
jgi:ribosomal protein S18 acetylase RimI-like enzyme